MPTEEVKITAFPNIRVKMDEDPVEKRREFVYKFLELCILTITAFSFIIFQLKGTKQIVNITLYASLSMLVLLVLVCIFSLYSFEGMMLGINGSHGGIESKIKGKPISGIMYYKIRRICFMTYGISVLLYLIGFSINQL